MMSSFTSTREDQYSDEAHFHLDCKVNSQNFTTLVTWEPDMAAEVLFYLVKNTIWCMRNRGVTGPTSSSTVYLKKNHKHESQRNRELAQKHGCA